MFQEPNRGLPYAHFVLDLTGQWQQEHEIVRGDYDPDSTAIYLMAAAEDPEKTDQKRWIADRIVDREKFWALQVVTTLVKQHHGGFFEDWTDAELRYLLDRAAQREIAQLENINGQNGALLEYFGTPFQIGEDKEGKARFLFDTEIEELRVFQAKLRERVAPSGPAEIK